MVASFDAVASATGFTATTTTLTFAHTCGASANLLIVPVAVGAQGSDAGASLSVTYNGVAMTSGGPIVHNNGQTAGFTQWFYLVNPTTGSSQNVVVTRSGGVGTFNLIGNAVSYNGAGVPTSVTSTTGATTPITGSQTPATGDLAGQFVGNGSALSAHTQTSRFIDNVNNLSAGGNMAYQDVVGDGTSKSFSVTSAAADWWSQWTFIIPASVSAGVDFGAGDWLLEDGSGAWLLEDSTGNWILDTTASAPVTATVTMAGTNTLAATGKQNIPATALMAGTSVLSVTGRQNISTPVTVVGTNTLAVTATVTPGASTLAVVPTPTAGLVFAPNTFTATGPFSSVSTYAADQQAAQWRFDFFGTALDIRVISGAGANPLTVQIDGGSVTTPTIASGVLGYYSLASGLTDTWHTVVVRTQATASSIHLAQTDGFRVTGSAPDVRLTTGYKTWLPLGATATLSDGKTTTATFFGYSNTRNVAGGYRSDRFRAKTASLPVLFVHGGSNAYVQVRVDGTVVGTGSITNPASSGGYSDFVDLAALLSLTLDNTTFHNYEVEWSTPALSVVVYVMGYALSLASGAQDTTVTYTARGVDGFIGDSIDTGYGLTTPFTSWTYLSSRSFGRIAVVAGAAGSTEVNDGTTRAGELAAWAPYQTVWNEFGTNDLSAANTSTPTSGFGTADVATLNALLTSSPTGLILRLGILPRSSYDATFRGNWNGAGANGIQANIAASSAPTRITYVDPLTIGLVDPTDYQETSPTERLHPNDAGNAKIAATAAALMVVPVTATVTMVNTGTLGVSTVVQKPTSVTFAGTNTLAVTPVLKVSSSVTVVGSSALAVSGLQQIRPAVAFVGISSLVVSVRQDISVTVAVVGVNSLTVTTSILSSAAATLTGLNSLSVSALLQISSGVAFVGANVLSVIGRLQIASAVTLTGVNTLSVTGQDIIPSTVLLVGSNALTVTGTQTITSTVIIVGIGVLTVSAVLATQTTVTIDNVSTLSVAGIQQAIATASLVGVNVLAVSPLQQVSSTVTLTGVNVLVSGAVTGVSIFISGVNVLAVSGLLQVRSTVTLVGFNALTVTSLLQIAAATSLSGANVLSVSSLIQERVTVSLPGINTVVISGRQNIPSTVSLVNAGILAVSGSQQVRTVVVLTNVGALVVSGSQKVLVTVTFISNNTLAVAIQALRIATVLVAGLNVLNISGRENIPAGVAIANFNILAAVAISGQTFAGWGIPI